MYNIMYVHMYVYQVYAVHCMYNMYRYSLCAHHCHVPLQMSKVKQFYFTLFCSILPCSDHQEGIGCVLEHQASGVGGLMAWTGCALCGSEVLDSIRARLHEKGTSGEVGG